MRLNFQENKPKTIIKYVEKKDYTIVKTIAGIILIGIVAIICLNVYKNSNCTNIEDSILEYAYDYANGNNLLILKEGESVTVSLNDVYASGYPKLSNGSTCLGSVKFTLADGKLIKTLNITDCSYCSTDQRYKSSWKSSNTLVNSKIIDVAVTYNYYNAETFYTKWTEWYPSSYINTSVNNQYGVRLPLDSKYLPAVPSTSEILKYEVEYDTYYTYRDQTWKWYKNANNDYTSKWYSEQPAGYTKKDESTYDWTEYSEWSLNYPETKSYREIKNATGYRWYYLDSNKNKHYWNGGAYSVYKPSDDYPYSGESATMHRYRDKIWRWYNGDARGYYSTYSSTQPSGYIYKDTLMSSYTKWSSPSSTEPEHKDYRTIETDIYFRYRAFYRDVNYLVLDSYVSKDKFEEIIGMNLESFMLDNTKKISYKYTYLYK